MTWILILYIYAGTFAKGDSVALASVPGFSSEVECDAAGRRAEDLVGASTKTARHVCVRQTK